VANRSHKSMQHYTVRLEQKLTISHTSYRLTWKGYTLVRKVQRNSDVIHITNLDGWESLNMVVRYTRIVNFESILKRPWGIYGYE